MSRTAFLGSWLLTLVVPLAVAPVASAAETWGVVKCLDCDKNEFVMMDKKDGKWLFHLRPDGKVIINGKEARLADLVPGDAVQVTYHLADDKQLARLVHCKRK
jgi:hypothetical protein